MIKTITRVLIAIITVYLTAALILTIAGLMQDPQVSDVCVVFGNKVEPSGEPSPSLASRLDKAILLYNQQMFPKIIVSGGIGKEGWDEAEVMADYLIRDGIPSGAILMDHEGNNTYLTAIHTAEIAHEHGFTSFLIISNFYHLPRARLAFHQVGLFSVTTAYANRFVARDFYYGLMREVIAYPVYYLKYSE